MFEGWYFEAYDNAFTKQIFSVGNHQVTFSLHIQHPSFSESEVMLISHMEASKKLIGITTDTGSDTDIAIMIASTDNTGFIGSTYAPSTIVLPE